MITFPNAKINIGLAITRRRPDGYHDIESIMVPVGWRDILEVVPSSSAVSSIRLSGRAIDCPPEKNLVMKALNALRSEIEFPPVDIYLRKIIPDGAGLGGGSADASFILKAVNDLFALDLTDDTLARIAATVGADCPFFVYNHPMYATGIGTTLSSVDIPQLDGLSILIVKPPIHISTAEAYAGVTPRQPATPLPEAIACPIETWRDTICNYFEQSLAPRFPMIDRIKGTLYACGALYASLSGSGSAIYGIFPDDELTAAAAAEFDGMETFAGHLPRL